MAIELTTATTQQLSGIRQSLGFPLIQEIYPESIWTLNSIDISYGAGTGDIGTIINFTPLKNFRRVRVAIEQSVVSHKGAEHLIGLEDTGTFAAFDLENCNFSASTLNQLFTDLPATNKTVTIRVVGTPGAATCDPTIATAKGYTVVTS